MTTLNELKSKGGLVQDAPIHKKITYSITDPESGELVDFEADIFVKEMSIGDYEKLYMSADDNRSRSAKIISEAVMLGKRGEERISFEVAYKLKRPLAEAMVAAFAEVNLPKKPSAPGKDSSAN
jgi:hypothetical protein